MELGYRQPLPLNRNDVNFTVFPLNDSDHSPYTAFQPKCPPSIDEQFNFYLGKCRFNRPMVRRCSSSHLAAVNCSSRASGPPESPTPIAMATSADRRSHTLTPPAVFPKQPNFAPRLEGETLSLESYTTFRDISARQALTEERKRSVSLTEGMFLDLVSNQRTSKPIFAHRCWASLLSSATLDTDNSAQVFNLFINSCEAPGFLAAVLRGGPRRETRGGFTFGFGAVQLKTFVGSQFWLHCKANVCNDSFSCYPRCTDIVRKANFEPVESNATSSAFVATDGPFQFSAEEDTEARTRKPALLQPRHQQTALGTRQEKRKKGVSNIVWVLLSVCSVLIFANTFFIICNELNRRQLRKKNKIRLWKNHL